MVPRAGSWESFGMKIANRFATRLVLTLALAAAATAWIPQEKGKRKLRMADAAPDLTRPVASQIA
ncbi:MAG: hypothetical protein B9S38_04465 [Verrucomicrobiia bacterium Tous-C4TDCM]|jgi:hypothetical protein|nr:MAG: hypothetical protein B9S38_04465 [Verrucomicrobiae bacterium Tous-C4TDCM]